MVSKVFIASIHADKMQYVIDDQDGKCGCPQIQPPKKQGKYDFRPPEDIQPKKTRLMR